jgi:hypothetical protein
MRYFAIVINKIKSTEFKLILCGLAFLISGAHILFSIGYDIERGNQLEQHYLKDHDRLVRLEARIELLEDKLININK